MKTKRYSPRSQTRKLLPKLPWQSHKFRRKMPAGHRICVGTKWLLIIIRRSSSFFLLGARRFRFNNLCTLVGEAFPLQVGADDSFSQWILFFSPPVCDWRTGPILLLTEFCNTNNSYQWLTFILPVAEFMNNIAYNFFIRFSIFFYAHRMMQFWWKEMDAFFIAQSC